MIDMENDCNIKELVAALLVKGSDYRGVYRIGAKVDLQVEESTGKVIATRGHGSVKLAYVIGPKVETIATCLRAGYGYSGYIVDIAIGPGGKLLHLKINPK